ncbi:MAG: PAS domain S-box protein [Myxococcales bacterium]|nr:PAS domain S-box protein [Myxococcales bacterium]
MLRALKEVGAIAVEPSRAEEAELAVADLSLPEGEKALADLRETPAGGRLSIIAIGELPAVSELGVADFLTPAAVERELPGRLRAALARHQALKEAHQRQRDLSLLLKLTGDYAESLEVEDLLHGVTRRLAEEMDIARASLVVLDEAQGAGFIVAASDDAALKDLRIELSRYPEIREVVRTGKPVIVEDAPTHPLLEGVKSQVAARGIQNIAALPLAVRGKVLGVLLLRASSRRGAFTSREIDLLATVAHATAVAFRNARHLESIRGQSEREKNARIAAEERARNLKRYESYFEHLSDGIAIVDESARVLSLNPAGLRLLDLSAQEAQGRHVNSAINPADDGLMLDLLLRVARGEQGGEVDVQARTIAGRRLTLSVSASPIPDGSGATILSMRDVTQARRLADELRQTKDFLERLIDSSVDAIIAADMKGKVVLFNKGAEAICAYAAEEALANLNVRDLYPPGEAKAVMAKLRSPDFGGKGRLTVSRQEIVTKKGERVPVNMTASIIYESERETATVGIFSDLRDRMQLERKLSDAQTRLEESERNAVIVALAGTAAHELNQPLTSVMGYAELLKRKLKETDFAYRPVDIIYREAERMAEIVRKIGKITRYETKSYIGAAKILDLEKASSHEE